MAEVTDLHRLVRVAETSAASAEDSSQCADSKKCVECLMAMQDVKVTTELLAGTGFGPRVLKLRKHALTDIATAAANVVSAWRRACTNQLSKERQPAKPSAEDSGSKDCAPVPRDSAPARPDACRAGSPAGNHAGPSKFSHPPPLSNQQRSKIRQTMGQALLEAVEGDDEGVEPFMIAAAIEEAVHSQKTDAEYKTRMRTIIFNLRDKKNPELRRRVVLGEVSPEEFAVMSSEEMASDKKQDEIKKIRAHMQKETKRTNNEGGNITDMFKCGKCKKRRCSYYQMQTRSADEPMTTFVRCLECTHRWKFC